MRNTRFIINTTLALLWAFMVQAQSLPGWAKGAWVVSEQSSNFQGEHVHFAKGSFTLFYNAGGDPGYPFQVESTTCTEPLYENDFEDAAAFFVTNQKNFIDLTGESPDAIPVLRVYCVEPRMGANIYFVKKNHLLLTYLGMVCHLRPERKCWFSGRKQKD